MATAAGISYGLMPQRDRCRTGSPLPGARDQRRSPQDLAVEDLHEAGRGVPLQERRLTGPDGRGPLLFRSSDERFGREAAPIRLESVQNANDQANVVAKAIAGSPIAYHAVPWFWSNQYDLRLQTVGLSGGHDDLVVRGDPRTRRFSLVYLRAGRVVALDCVNATKDYVAGRRLVEQGAFPDRSLLADPNLALKELAP